MADVSMNPIEYAKKGDIQYFRRADKDVLLKARDKDDYSVLDTAICAYHQECSIEICKKCPELLYHQERNGQGTALHHASYRGLTKVLDFMIKTADEIEKKDMEGGGGDQRIHRKFLRMVNISGKNSLLFAAENNHLEAAKLLMEADPDYEYSGDFLGNNALLNAMEKARSGHQDAARMRKLILEMQPYHCKLRRGDKSWTPLHLSASKGDLDAIKEIIQFCPEFTELVDDDSQNFLHIAAQFGHTKVVKHVMKINDIAPSILNAQDINGNTPLHVAALSGNEKLAKYLLYNLRVSKTTVNNQGQEVLDAITFIYDKKKAGVVDVRDRVNEKKLKEQSDFDLVVGALIAAVSFTAGITVPGGYISDGPNQGMAVLSKATAFETFVVSNTVGLLLSLYAVFSHFCARLLLEKKDIELQVTVAKYCTLGAILSMMVAFISGSYAVLNISHRLAMTVTILCCIFFIFTFWAIWRMIMQYKTPSSWCNKWCSFLVIFNLRKEQQASAMPGSLPV